MCEALRDLMKEEIESEVQEKSQKAVDTALLAAIKSAMKTFGLSAFKAMDSLSIPDADKIRYASRLK